MAQKLLNNINNSNNYNQTNNNVLQIQVYDTFTIDYNKYPRIGTPKYETDIVMIQFLMNQDYLDKVSKSYNLAIQFFNECKEYYFLLKSLDGKQTKRYSAKEIMFIMNQINGFTNRNSDVYSIQKYLRNFHPMDQLYYILIKNKDFYNQLFFTINDAKYAFFERREINYKFFIPFDFYGDVKSMNMNRGQVYTAIELLEINAYVQFLVKNKIIKNLPEPLFLRNYFDIDKLKKKDFKQQSLINNNNNNQINKNINEFKENNRYIEFDEDLKRIIDESNKEENELNEKLEVQNEIGDFKEFEEKEESDIKIIYFK